MAELPYQAEYAKTGRAACKGCKEKIDQGVLRIAIMVQSAFFDGKQANWHHDECFFKKRHPASANEIANFNKLKYDDQKKLKDKIENFTGVVMPEAPSKGKGKAKKRAANEGNAQAIKDFAVEYSKSSRATCKHCDIKICKDEVRICKILFDTDIGSRFNGQPVWHHVKCFAECRQELLYFAGGDSLPGFKTLKKEDQEMVKNEIKPMQADEIPIKKLKDEPKDDAELKEEQNKEVRLKNQNELFHKYRSGLKGLKKSQLHEILDANGQHMPAGIDECLDHLSDCMAFGAPQRCPECRDGQLVLDTFGYKCTGNISEWTSCSYVTQEPKRKKIKIPSEYKKDPAFKKLKPLVGVREFQAAPVPFTIVKSEPALSIKKEIPVPPLKNLQFFVYGSTKDKEETKKRILRLGGLVPSKLSESIVCGVASRTDLDRMPNKIQQLQELDRLIVEPAFLDLIDPKNGTVAKSLQILKENNIADWGADPATIVSQDIIDGKSIPKSGSSFVKSTKSGPVKLKIQDGAAVDPDSGLAEEAHVFVDASGAKCTVVLTQTDLVSQKNSFYKMQVLESNVGKRYWLFRSWGRIGTTIGGKKVEPFRGADDAVDRFAALYMERTENDWACRKNFKKVPGRYYPLDVDYGQDEAKEVKFDVDDKSSLPVPVQKLVAKIFDVSLMKKTMLEFELDTEKMPLGKLSKEQLKAGYTVLSDVLKLLLKGKVNQTKVIDATNRFFTLIPHDFGMNNPPLLDNEDLIKNKIEMLDNLLEIEIAYTLLQSDKGASSSIVDAHYLKLKCDIAPLNSAEPEYELIAEYLRNTHAATHSHYKLALEQVFKVVREGEDKRYKPFKKLHNRRLLWHGSRVTNFAGILSQGLRIAPPEAPVTGYMFGKGIYFADMVSKSANYCSAGPSNPVGILLLCEVALGNMKECYQAENVRLKSDQHSAWGVGRTRPDPALDRTLPDGTLVPLGTPVSNNVNTALLYNEFIVYDVAQVNVKYLLQVKFDYK